MIALRSNMKVSFPLLPMILNSFGMHSWTSMRTDQHFGTFENGTVDQQLLTEGVLPRDKFCM